MVDRPATATPSWRFNEVLLVIWSRILTPWRLFWRRTWFYRLLLNGRLAEKLSFYPYDALPRRLEDADAVMRGRFRFLGHVEEAGDKSIFDRPTAPLQWQEALHAFEWLPPLSAAGGDPARRIATELIGKWVRKFTRYGQPEWSPEVMAKRLIHLFAHGRMVIINSDLMWRSKLFVSLREQSRMLARIAREAPDGLPRLETAAAVVLSGICLENTDHRIESGLAMLEEEVAIQILPDGGHVSRSPEALLNAYRHIMMVIDALRTTQREVPPSLRSAYDRMAPMIRFFRHGDGGLGLFNGGHECDPKVIAGLLARDEVRGQPLGHARHSGYQRLAAARSLLLFDCGTSPPREFSTHAHAGALAFEFSTGEQRLIVNCGATSALNSSWATALRATAAHSTLTLSDRSSASIQPKGIVRDLLGARLCDGPVAIEMRRNEGPHGWTLLASHDGYVAPFGLRHERQLTLSPRGDTLTGADRLLPDGPPPQGRKRSELPFAIRFHIHPEVRVSPSQGGGMILKLPTGEGWRFRTGGQLSVEESVYLGSEQVRRCEQLVITGAVKDQPVEVAWVFEQIGAS
ncbi:MAG TPA: heparinase II/III family protein [Rhizomicrobium sp.]|nr:heparinase II/III family protein [Rhizomicrobium sp.]